MSDNNVNSNIVIPGELLPRDGRFGSGPSKVRKEAVDVLASRWQDYLGTSHRQKTVKSVVDSLRRGLSELFALPEGYEVVLANGGASYFWDTAVFSLIEHKSQHLSFGEFSSKFAASAKKAPFIEDPQIILSEPGTHPLPVTNDEIDLYALTHNETSTGVAMEIRRPEGATGLVAVDATSGAGGLMVDPTQFDCYYFSPQKAFSSDGGLWLAAMSPAALERARSVAASGRYIPPALDLVIAIDNSLLDQTYNTPALATIFLMNEQVNWMLANGGLAFAAGRSERSSSTVYSWAESSKFATPFVKDPAMRSKVVATIDFSDDIDAKAVATTLRANGIVDTEPYRKLGRNQLRVAVFPSVDPEDVEKLVAAIDYVVERL
ncbi:MAG: phosphoserine transaminase [Actinomycetota bacterium]|nr:phosphoserine transaminase [Actinomycetota bacterium]